MSAMRTVRESYLLPSLISFLILLLPYLLIPVYPTCLLIISTLLLLTTSTPNFWTSTPTEC